MYMIFSRLFLKADSRKITLHKHMHFGCAANPNNISRYILLTSVSTLTPECIDDPNVLARE